MISVFSKSPLASGHERIQEGDIVTMRKPLGYCNFGEMSSYLWLLIQGPDTSILDRLKDGLAEEDIEDAPIFDKRRYCIPLKRLPVHVDLARVRDVGDRYQPFFIIDEETGKFLAKPSPLRVEGLVFDKRTGRYL